MLRCEQYFHWFRYIGLLNKAAYNSHYEKVGDAEPVCIDDEIPFELPDGWAWARLGSLGIWQAGSTPKTTIRAYYENGTIPWLVTGDLNDGIINSIPKRITNKALVETSVKLNPPGSVLIAMYGATIGKLGILSSPATTNQACCAFIPFGDVSSKFIFYFLLQHRSLFRSQGIGGAQNNISKEIITGTMIAVPPRNEQQQIADYIDLIFDNAMCLESAQEQLESLLFKTRSKVLDLAIRGKLVPQDPTDEPASVLLERVRQEKLRMVAEGKLKKKDIAKDSIIYRGDDNSYYERTTNGEVNRLEVELFDLPKSWSWVRLGCISNYGSASSIGPDEIENDAWILDLEDIEKDTGKILRFVNRSDRPSLSTKRPFRKGQLLYSKLRPYLNKVLIAPKEGYCTSEILPIEFYGKCNPGYLRLVLMSDYFLAYANQCSYGVKMPRLGTNDGLDALIPLPPLKEQESISNAVRNAVLIIGSGFTK